MTLTRDERILVNLNLRLEERMKREPTEYNEDMIDRLARRIGYLSEYGNITPRFNIEDWVPR